MPKVTFTHSFGTGSLLDAETFCKLLYSPGSNTTTPNSLEVLNGHLNRSNLNESVVEYHDYTKANAQLSMQGIRPGALSRGNMTGSVLNLHYMANQESVGGGELGGLWNGLDVGKSVLPIPSTGVSVFVPTSGTLVLMWQVSAAHDANPEGQTKSQELTRLYLMERKPAKAISRETPLPMQVVSGYNFTLPQPNGLVAGPSRSPMMDRVWSGHAVIRIGTPEYAGWYDYCIGLWSSAANVKIRVRNMQYMWFNRR